MVLYKVTLVFCFGPKPKFRSSDLDLDQAEQQYTGSENKLDGKKNGVNIEMKTVLHT